VLLLCALLYLCLTYLSQDDGECCLPDEDTLASHVGPAAAAAAAAIAVAAAAAQTHAQQ
jgi:hypothetical protein